MTTAGPGRRTDAAVRLGSGRQLGFAEWGDPWGVPVLVFHPAPGSRRMALSSDAAAHELGVRLICLERPGFGLSEYVPRRKMLDWPVDVAEFADILGLRTFAVIGLSAGGPYALACGYRIPDRLTGVGAIAGLVPPDCYRQDELIGLIRHDPDRARQLIRRHLEALAADVEAAVGELANRAGRDGEVYSRAEVRADLVTTGREALRSGIAGLATDIWLHHNPWGFVPSQVTTRVHWWHGDRDELTPLAAVQQAMGRVPHGKLTVFEGEGHAISIDHGDDILATVARWS